MALLLPPGFCTLQLCPQVFSYLKMKSSPMWRRERDVALLTLNFFPSLVQRPKPCQLLAH